MGCICRAESKINNNPPNKPQNISSNIPQPSYIATTHRYPPKAVGTYSSDKVNLQYPYNRDHVLLTKPILRHRDGSNRYPIVDDTEVDILTLNKENDVSLEITSLFYLDSKYRDPSRDCDYSQAVNDGERSTIAGHPYYLPYGWKFLGIQINERETEDWAITYHGTKSHLFNTICEEGYKIGQRNAYGRGVYSSPMVEVASGYAEIFTFEGVTYIGVLQNRVNQNGAIIENNGQYWICPNPANIIPYGLCVKKVNSGFQY